MMEPVQPEIFIQPVDPAAPASRWVVIGASVQGTSHIKVGLSCQDAHAYKAITRDVFAAVVADGLGTALHAEIGSKLAAASALAYLEEALSTETPGDADSWIKLAQDCFNAARARLEEEALHSQAALRDFATTLVMAILTPDWLVTGQIGDGAVVAALEDGSLVSISLPQNDEYVNVTYPLTMPDMLQNVKCAASLLNVKALALMSDGMQPVSIRSLDQSPHAPFFEPLFRQLSGVKDMPKASLNLAEFMASNTISSRTDDDKTLVLVGRRNLERDNPLITGGHAPMHSHPD